LASRQGFGELKTEQLGGHSQEQQRHRQAPIDDDDIRPTVGGYKRKTCLSPPFCADMPLRNYTLTPAIATVIQYC